jgi:hypothetical protein
MVDGLGAYTSLAVSILCIQTYFQPVSFHRTSSCMSGLDWWEYATQLLHKQPHESMTHRR